MQTRSELRLVNGEIAMRLMLINVAAFPYAATKFQSHNELHSEPFPI